MPVTMMSLALALPANLSETTRLPQVYELGVGAPLRSRRRQFCSAGAFGAGAPVLRLAG